MFKNYATTLNRLGRPRFYLAFVQLMIATGVASAQQFSTVQLPTFQRFSMTTSVLVPDQGGVYAGGSGRAARSGSRRLGGSGVSAGGVTVTAFIHDFEALDAAVLERGQRLRERSGRTLSTLQPGPVTSVRPQRQVSLGEVRQHIASKQDQRRARAQADYELAQRLLAKDKPAAAQILLKSAFKRAAKPLQTVISQQLAALREETSTANAAVASTRLTSATASSGPPHRQDQLATPAIVDHRR